MEDALKLMEQGIAQIRKAMDILQGEATRTEGVHTESRAKPVESKKSDAPRRRKTIPKVVRTQVWGKTYGMEVGSTECCVCKKNVISQSDFECAHIIAEAQGGPPTIENLIATCAQCNRSMGTRNLREFQASMDAARLVMGIPAPTPSKGMAFMERFAYRPAGT